MSISSDFQQSSGGTARLEVSNMAFMLERIAADTEPYQFIRELTQNSIEAVQALGGGEISWSHDEGIFEATGIRKLTITDTGTGMTGPEMVSYINYLAASIKEQSLDKNFGIGAKITAGVQNPAGLIYQSWKNGQGSMVWFWKDPLSGEYGLREFKNKNGDATLWLPLSDENRPSLIGSHGTRVVLMGQNAEHETFYGMNPDQKETTHWITHYLNSRYLTFDADITLRVAEISGEKSEHLRNREIQGQNTYIDTHSQEQGVVQLSDASVKWALLKDGDHLRSYSSIVESAGHIGVVHENEVYEKLRANAGYAMLNNFGIIAGPRRVVLYIEPKGKVEPSTSRSTIKINGSSVDWNRWADEFSRNMPEALERYQIELLQKDNDLESEQRIVDKLREYRELFQVSNYLSPADRSAELGNKRPSGKRRRKEHIPEGTKENKEKRDRRRPSNIVPIKPSTDFGDEAGGKTDNKVIDIPKIVWVSVAERSRTEGDELEDKAAKYVSGQNMIVANLDFRGFKDLTNKILSKFSDKPQAKPIVISTVKEWYELTLTEHVLHGRNLSETGPWDRDDIDQLFSPISMTAAVMPTINLANRITQVVSSKIGQMRKQQLKARNSDLKAG